MHIFLVMMMLVVPTFTHAMSCGNSMQKNNSTMQHSMQVNGDEQPCPHNMQQQVFISCDNMMSIADCLGVDTDMALPIDSVSLHISKYNMDSVAILPSYPWKKEAITVVEPRGPPAKQALLTPQQSLIFTTQRFRI